MVAWSTTRISTCSGVISCARTINRCIRAPARERTRRQGRERSERRAVTDEPVASLGMYDFPWTAAANDALWAALGGRLRAAGVAAPVGLTRGVDLHALWRSPGLIFGQTCGFPYVTALRASVALIATPVYAFAGCRAAAHRS